MTWSRVASNLLAWRDFGESFTASYSTHKLRRLVGGSLHANKADVDTYVHTYIDPSDDDTIATNRNVGAGCYGHSRAYTDGDACAGT